MLNYYFESSIPDFLEKSIEEILGAFTKSSHFDSTVLQNRSWEQQIPILKKALAGYNGTIFFEFSIPRMGRRIDTLVIIEGCVFVIEFKVGEKNFLPYHVEQVWDYALDLKNFHKPSHKAILVPVLVATKAPRSVLEIITTSHHDNLLFPVKSNAEDLQLAIQNTLNFSVGAEAIDVNHFKKGSYSPTPTIIEAAVSLYNNHSVEDITRSSATEINLTKTTTVIADIIDYAKQYNKKVICFVTGVPGAGKTLVGLKVATTHLDKEKGNTSIYLSGNAPLVAILQEALTRDKVGREALLGNRMTKLEAKKSVKSFIQIIHHYRDAYLTDPNPPYDHVAIFDEAQRAWNKEQTVKFMRQKKNQANFDYSEPEFLISCLDRHPDWAVVVCLVGGGQEINTGEAGISEWLYAISNRFQKWEVYISPNLTDKEYAAEGAINLFSDSSGFKYNEDLHLSVSMRSFRAENLSLFVKNLLDLDDLAAIQHLQSIIANYPIVVTRDLNKAKQWLKEKARGSERYGMVVSSQAIRLKPLAVDVKSPMNPVHWFLEGKDDIRSSYYLEDVATEFHIQGLELDWACVIWDGDLRYGPQGWQTYSFKGSSWQNIKSTERKKYLINAYRVLLTRARQGMVIVVPDGNKEDHTRKPEFYDPTFHYLKRLGLQTF